ncbi:MAG TPA: hypothetical protein VMH24_04960 [Candidatus Sulfotelmatobacter sp.]|nr:hypothetical protein [Candidatus Sulfotelmatobacter sp.]
MAAAQTHPSAGDVILRDIPGLTDPDLQPPQVAEVRDPFADLRVVHLVARAPRGVPLRVRDLVDQLNAEHVDWSFSRPVVVAAILQLQANWLSDYRNSDGIAFDEDATGPTVTVEDTSRVDPWMIRQVARLRDECELRLRAFAVQEGALP